MSFKEMILKNLQNNGFPTKKVSFDLEKLYELADKKGENLNKVLEQLAGEGIEHEKTVEKIIFSQTMSQEKFQMNPDMMEQARKMMAEMSPEELENIRKQFESMSPEQKQQMMEQAKKMGMF